MALQTIQLQGINRSLPDNVVPDGMMQELINLRPKDGALRPVGSKDVGNSILGKVLYVYKINSSVKIVIGYNTDCISYYVYTDNSLFYTDLDFIYVGTGKIFKCVGIGKVISLVNLTDNTIKFLVYNPDSKQLSALDGIPELPRFSMSRIAKVTSNKTMTVSSLNADDIYAHALKLMAEGGSGESGFCTGEVLIRFAWELTDGTIVKHSIPLRIKISEFSMSDSTTLVWNAYELNINVLTANADLQNIQTTYKGLIASLNVYCCPMQELQKGIYGNSPIYFCPWQNTPSPAEEHIYYKIASVPLEDITSAFNSKGFYAHFADLTSLDQITTDNYTHHKIIGNSVFGYNNRVFFGDTVVRLSNFPGAINALGPWPGGSTGTAYEVGFEFDIATSAGKKTVFTGWTSWNYYTSGGDPILYSYGSHFGYPDSRAYQVRVYVRASSIIYLITTKSLKPQKTLNFAYCDGVNESPVGSWAAGGYQVVSLTNNPDGTYQDHNRIQASELNNPFYYPAINSYRIGNGQILGMTTNAIALSQGQFGQFPIFCFTTEGIWTMSIGSGELLINTISPLSRQVCNNPDSITPIDNGVVFTTSKALMILSGATPLEISESAEGSYQGRITGTLNYEAIANNPNLYQVKEFLCSVDFLTYVAGAKIAWDYVMEEIIVSNSSKPYSWVFSLKTKLWFKISQSFEYFVPEYPVTYGYKTISESNYKYNMSEESFSQLITVHAETRQMKLSSAKAFKKIERLLIEGRINDNLDYPFSVNLFGSPDGTGWYLLNNGNTFGSRQPLLIGRTNFSCKLFILVIGGKVDELAYFNLIDTDFDEKYMTKLR